MVTGVRARARAEITAEIKTAARRHLEAEGAAGLSLRAVAREIGMVSSAVYRYFPSRDDLLTALIVDAYDAVGDAAEAADDPGAAPEARWLTVCRAVRAWALAHPHEYALVYGSPVPGYRAPETTIGPASRVTIVLARILNAGAPRRPSRRLPKKVEGQARRIADAVMPDVPLDTVVRGVMAWTHLFGAISFELFGHFVGAVDDPDAFFDATAREMAAFVGLYAGRLRAAR